MAVIFIDGFDHYTATNNTSANGVMASPYTFPGGTAAKINTASLTSGMVLSAGSGLSRAVDLLLPSTYNSGTLGFGAHVHFNATNSDDRGAAFVASSTLEFGWRIDGGSGTIYLVQPGGTLTDCGVLAEDTLYHIELKAVLVATTGSLELRINGVTAGTVTGLSLNNLGIDRLTLGYPYTGSTGWQVNFDDLFIWDGTGTVNNDFLGERNVSTLYPNADTATADWLLSTGTSGFDLINDVPPADATNYLSSATVGDESQFDIQSLVNTGVTITTIQVTARADKDDSGAGSLILGAIGGSGGADYSAAKVLTQDQFLYFFHVSEINPDTSAQWTASDITSAKVSIKRA